MLLIAMNVVLVDAIVGVGLPSMEIALKAVEGGLARLAEGRWVWDVEALAQLELGTLETLYMNLKAYGASRAGAQNAH